MMPRQCGGTREILVESSRVDCVLEVPVVVLKLLRSCRFFDVCDADELLDCNFLGGRVSRHDSVSILGTSKVP